jgi:WD40 repeat protein
MSLGSRLTAVSDALFSRLARFRFRYDLFLSYARSDGKPYALKLRDQLRALDFSCFLDQDELPPGNSLRSSLSRALRRSATLVVVGTERALKSTYVAQEISEFAATGRTIIPIDFQGTLADPPWSVLRERDLVWIDETREALERGAPSPVVADGIDKLFKYTRRNVRVRGQILATAVVFLVGAAVSGWIINGKVRDLAQATIAANKAEAAAKEAKEAEEAATQKAQWEKQRAEQEASKAKKQERIAHQNAERAKQEQQRAEEQTRESQARLLATEAERGLVDGGTDGLIRGVLLATESLRKMQTLEGRIALVRGLSLLPPRPEAVFPSSCGIVRAAVFHPDGRWLAVGGDKGLAVLNAAASWRKERSALEGRPVRALAFSPDGIWLAAGVDREIHVLDARSGQTVATIPPGEHLREPVRALAFSPDGKYLAAATEDFTATVLTRSPEDGAWHVVLSPSIDAAVSRVLSLAFSSDGRWLVLGGVNGIAIWDLTQKEKAAQAEARQVIRGIAFSHDRGLITAGDQEILFWQVHLTPAGSMSLEESRESRIPLDRESKGLVLGPDERFFVTWTADQEVHLWHTAERQEHSRMILGGKDEPAVAFTPDGGRLVTGSGDKLSVWPASGSHELTLLEGRNAAAFSPSGRWLAVGGKRQVRLLQVPLAVPAAVAADPGSWPELARWESGDQVFFISFSPDGRWLAMATAKAIQVIDTRTRRIVMRRELGGEEQLAALRFSPGSRWLVAIEGDAVHRIATDTWQAAPPVEPQVSLKRLALSPDETWMTTGTEFFYVRGEGLVRPTLRRIYEVKTGRRVAWQSMEEDDLRRLGGKKSLHFQSPGEGKAGGRMDLLRQAPSWGDLPVRKLNSVRSPDDRWEAWRDTSRGVALFDTDSTYQVDFLPHEGIASISFSPDGRWLVTAGEEAGIKVWPLLLEDLMDQVCASVPRNLGPKEWPAALQPPASYRTCPAVDGQRFGAEWTAVK